MSKSEGRSYQTLNGDTTARLALGNREQRTGLSRKPLTRGDYMRYPNLARQLPLGQSEVLVEQQLLAAHEVLAKLTQQYGGLEQVPHEILDPVQSTCKELMNRYFQLVDKK